MIPKISFGRTGHSSSRLIFGSWAVNTATQEEADRVLEWLLQVGINHIDTAPMYGDAEKRIGSWMEVHRDDFFISTKTRSRTYQGAWRNLENSLEHLHVDQIDLWQMHGLTGPQGWEKAMRPGGTLEAFIKARDQGLVRYLGITGHGIKAPAMHLQSLGTFDFDSVMLPYNYLLMQNPRYATAFEELASLCRARSVALQTFMSIAQRPWSGRPKDYNTYFYEPMVEQEPIDKAVHWAMGLPDIFLLTVGDLQFLPQVLEAASRFEGRPAEAEMDAMVEKFAVQPVYS